MEDTQGAARASSGPAGSKKPRTITQCRIMHEKWTITKQTDGKLHCQHGAFRFTARTPEEAHDGIVLRETPQRFSEPAPEGMTVADLGRWLAEPGF